jgi:hypothetical protein
MPNDQFRDETDGDPNTVYEDTEVHDERGDRTGFYMNDDEKMRTESKPPQQPQQSQ